MQIKRVGDLQPGCHVAYVAIDGGQIRDSVGVIFRPADGALQIIPHQPDAEDEVPCDAVRSALLRAISDDFVPLGGRFFQAILSATCGMLTSKLPRIDAQVATVRLHKRLTGAHPTAPEPTVRRDPGPALQFHEVVPSERVSSLFSQCEIDTQDSPILGQLRSTEQAYAAFVDLRTAQAESPDAGRSWYLARSGDQDVGLLITSPAPDGAAWSIDYLGVIAGHRRRGTARALLALLDRTALAAEATELLVDADAANVPAVALYRAAGFTPAARYGVGFMCVEQLREDEAGPPGWTPSGL